MPNYVKKVECPHNEGCHCNPNKRDCEKCGWNPVVAEKRKQAMEKAGGGCNGKR